MCVFKYKWSNIIRTHCEHWDINKACEIQVMITISVTLFATFSQFDLDMTRTHSSTPPLTPTLPTQAKGEVNKP